MKILQAKIRGLGTTMESDWFTLSPTLNLLHFSEQTSATNFLRALQTINPPYSCHALRPFSDFPNVSRHRGYLQRISPKKRTVAMAVFAATPKVVNELGIISDLLYQTDRIEVGRRLDYSRWVNFVELASSTRWSEIAADMDNLLDQANRVAPHLAAELHSLINSVRPSDRIKQELKNGLLQWLQTAGRELGTGFEEQVDATREAVMRADYFQTARAIVYQRLPIFLAFGCSPLAQSTEDLLEWIGVQVPRMHDNPAVLDHAFLDTLNHQLSQLHSLGAPLRIDCTGTTLSMRGAGEAASGQVESAAREVLSELQETICLALAFSRTLYHTEPILLFDAPESLVPEEYRRELAQWICEIAETCQCIYASPHIEIFPENCGAKVYDASTLVSKNAKNQSPETVETDSGK